MSQYSKEISIFPLLVTDSIIFNLVPFFIFLKVTPLLNFKKNKQNKTKQNKNKQTKITKQHELKFELKFVLFSYFKHLDNI